MNGLTMKRMIILVSVLILVVFIIWFFNGHNEIVKTVISATVETASVKKIPFSKTINTYGTVNISPDNIQQITIQNEAMVQQIFVSQGQHVNKGDPLVLLATTASASLNLKNAKIAVDFTRNEQERARKLRDQFLATNADVQIAEQSFDKAEATFNNLTQQQQKETSNILRSPCSCNIVLINIQPGQIIPPATTVLTYANTNKVQIRLGIEYEDLSLIHEQQKVIVRPVYNNAISYTGYVSNITDQINTQTGLIDVIIHLENATRLIPGSMVNAKIYLQKESENLAVPRSAVLFENNKPYVFIDNKGIALKRWVTVGEDDGSNIAIMNGLDIHDRVVVVGNYELQDGMKLKLEKQT